MYSRCTFESLTKVRSLAMALTATGKFLVVLMVCCAHVSCSFNGNYTDRLSLLEFKKTTSDPQQALMSWNDSNHFCSWEGVLCRRKIPRRVTSLDLGNRGLAGHISPSLGNLTFLKHLLLATNVFSGQIPHSLGQLHRLETLYLSNNTLQGIIPSFTNSSNLKVLWLDRNNLAGKFPDVPPGLVQLQLSGNNLVGTIPSSLANITTLKGFSCAFNNIEGSIPTEFARLPELQKLYVGSNRLEGRFPQAILNLSTLDGLSLNTNHFSGKVPSNLGSSLPNLQLFSIAGNFFHGHIPSSLINASALYSVLLSNNSFTGVVPSSIGALAKLSLLNIERNQLKARNKQDWEFLNSLANCTNLKGLSLAGNEFEGPVPASLGNLSIELQSLYLGGNKLSGDFPSGIENLRNLILLGLDYNQFSGVVPKFLGPLSLQALSLSNNMFTGFIPSSISNLSHLVDLSLDSNQFVGSIPTSLGNLRNLATVSISNNNLTGNMPREIFGSPTIAQIDLSFNNLDGKLPTEVGNAKQLISLQLSSNKLSTGIPSTLGDCESLEDIELDNNIFSGSIPVSLGNIKTIKVLNLSHNNLTGSIPASLGDIQLLDRLDLSFNNLEGEVPAKGIFKNKTAMRIDGNLELCGGLPELHLPDCSVNILDSTKHKLSVVLKVVIPVAIMVLLAVLLYILSLFRRRKQKTNSVSVPYFGRQFPKISYSDIVKATDGFSTSNIIGQGRYGSVYQGELFQDGHVVAIKVFSLETRGAQKSFIAECNALRDVRHRNIVPILTACLSIDSNGNDFKALVYKFMPRGDLHNLLYSTQESVNTSDLNYVSLSQRLNIVVDVSDALAYLHHNHQETIVHCDIKPSNILLDDYLVAHVGDFGLAKYRDDSTSSSTDSNSISSAALMGTIGYVAPECSQGGRVSTASDVYSFGVVLLEVFIRRRPTDDMFKDGMSIVKFTEINFPDNLLQIVDPQLLQGLDLFKDAPTAIKDSGAQILQSVLTVGLSCTKTSPSERIGMQEVAAKLHGIRDAYSREN